MPLPDVMYQMVHLDRREVKSKHAEFQRLVSDQRPARDARRVDTCNANISVLFAFASSAASIISATMPHAREQDLLCRLEDWRRRFHRLRRLCQPASRRVSSAGTTRARTIFTAIKVDLRAECARTDAASSEYLQADSERRWYREAILRALWVLRTPVEERPEMWANGLRDAEEEMRDAILDVKAGHRRTTSTFQSAAPDPAIGR